MGVVVASIYIYIYVKSFVSLKTISRCGAMPLIKKTHQISVHSLFFLLVRADWLLDFNCRTAGSQSESDSQIAVRQLNIKKKWQVEQHMSVIEHGL